LSSERGDGFLVAVSLSVSDEAIILRARPYGESDKIVTFLAAGAGKLTGIAKGAKNSRRRFANCLDVFTRVRVHYRTRAGATLAFMESCDLLEPAGILVEPNKFAYGNYLIELVDLLTEEAHPIPGVFQLLAAALIALRAGPATPALLRGFEMQLLCDAGYEPQMLACGRCQRPLSLDDAAVLDFHKYSVACNTCVTSATTISGATLHTVEALKHRTLEDLRTTRFGPQTSAEAAQLISMLLAPHLHRPLKSLKLIATLQG
jgi:DNA repair protein RecO (recombination protein O)